MKPGFYIPSTRQKMGWYQGRQLSFCLIICVDVWLLIYLIGPISQVNGLLALNDLNLQSN